jgi:uncharacterized protein with PIN domain
MQSKVDNEDDSCPECGDTLERVRRTIPASMGLYGQKMGVKRRCPGCRYTDTMWV